MPDDELTSNSFNDDEDADSDSEEETEEKEEAGKESTGASDQEEKKEPDGQEDLLERAQKDPRLSAYVRETVQQTLALERQKADLAASSAKEEQRLKDLSSIEDEEERRDKLAELGAETLKRREEDSARTRFRDEYAKELWSDIQRVDPEIGQVLKEKAEDLRSAKTDGELVIRVADARAAKVLAAKEARIKELEQALEAQKNAAAAGKNREKPLDLPGGGPGKGGSADEIKDPVGLLSSAFKEAEEEEK